MVDFSAAKSMRESEPSPRRGLIVVDGVLENGGGGGGGEIGWGWVRCLDICILSLPPLPETV